MPTTPLETKRKRLVMTTEERPIPTSTVAGLIESFRDCFRDSPKPEKLVYERGKPTYTVERLVPEDVLEKEDGGDAFLTPFQMIRQHSDLEIQEPIADPLEAIARAVQSLSSRNVKLTMFVCENREVVRSWFGRDLRLEDIWQVPLLEDPDARDRGIFVAGSKVSSLIRDVEVAVFCRFPEGRL